VSRGAIASDFVQAEITGDILLMDDPMQSRLRLKIVLTPGPKLEPFKAFLKDAEWADGLFHYALSGTFARPRFRAESERRARVGPRTALDGPPAIGLGAAGKGADDAGAARLTPGGAEESDEERAARREKTIEERRRRLEERRRDMGRDGLPARPRMVDGRAPVIDDEEEDLPLPPDEEEMPPGLPEFEEEP
jgi:hypothetical protein